MRIVVNYSGGVCSFLAAKRAVDRFSADAVTLLFADTREEDSDLYRFMREGAAYLGCRLVEVHADVTMDELIDRENAIPSSRMGFCTRVLKQEPAAKWIEENGPFDLHVFGMEWTETHRLDGLERRLGKDKVWCPMMERPYWFKAQMLDEVRKLGIEPSTSYAQGFHHDNCGGGCVKGGHAAWAHTIRTRPEVAAKWMEREDRISERRGKPCTAMKDRRGGTAKPLSVRELSERLETEDFDALDFGGCGCFVESESASAELEREGK